MAWQGGAEQEKGRLVIATSGCSFNSYFVRCPLIRNQNTLYLEYLIDA